MVTPFSSLPAAMQDHYRDLQDELYDGMEDEVRELTRQALERGSPAEDVLEHGLLAGMRLVGDDFADGVLFVPEMLRAAIAMKAAMNLLRPLLAGSVPGESLGVAVIGTVRGDIHDIGKNLVAAMWVGAGLEVIDLGINVDAHRFVQAVREHGAQVLGLSTLLTTALPAMARVVEELREAGLRDRVTILVGGAPLSADFAREVGADAWGRDANEAVRLARAALSRADNR